MKFSKAFAWLARLILGGLFTYAGVMKLQDPNAFSRALASLGILPASSITPLATGLPAVEVAFGLSVLAIPSLRRAGVLGLAVLLAVFVAVLGWAVASGKEMECSCFGAGSVLEVGGLPGAMARNLLLLAMASYLFYQRDEVDRSGRSDELVNS